MTSLPTPVPACYPLPPDHSFDLVSTQVGSVENNATSSFLPTPSFMSLLSLFWVPSYTSLYRAGYSETDNPRRHPYLAFASSIIASPIMSQLHTHPLIPTNVLFDSAHLHTDMATTLSNSANPSFDSTKKQDISFCGTRRHLLFGEKWTVEYLAFTSSFSRPMPRRVAFWMSIRSSLGV